VDIFVSKRKKLEARRREVIADIRGERLAFETMQQRAQIAGETPDNSFVQSVLTRLMDYEQRANTEVHIDELDDLVDDAEEQGQLRAYMCPLAEIRVEAGLSIDRMEEWNVPKAVISKWRASVSDNFEISDRGTLRAIFKEYDSWLDYTSIYEKKMLKYTRILFVAIIVCPLLAVGAIRFSPSYFSLIVILLAGVTGSCVSVMAKMPMLEVSSSGELESYERRVWTRIGVGVIAGVIGCALLGWGLLPIVIHDKPFSDVLNACMGSQAAPCTGLNTLIILCIPMLFGFSERALVSFEQQFLSGKS
jgi:hypothetical protein